MSTALVIAHPGHELRVYGWLERERPEVLVLTDGSGHGETSRLTSTAAVLERAGARPGPVFGRFSDREMYRILLERDVAELALVVHELAAALAASNVTQVACDAIEGYNPSHDICRVVTDAAAAIARRRTGRAIAVYDFLLEGRPGGCAESSSSWTSEESIRLELRDEALARKLEAARSYPEMAFEVERSLDRHGAAAFAVESLRPADPDLDLEALFPEPPFYEVYGERQVAAGHYRSVVRFREHFLPIARALCELGRTA
jgi:hypothetical protein